uniref:Vacuolar protein sorting-associated protein 54 n=1 Tax=Parastrongyloides trichosuri TaxID=131310 RepID=A0A0N4ZXL0_PARTI
MVMINISSIEVYEFIGCRVQNLSSVIADPKKSKNENLIIFTKHWGDSFVPAKSIPVDGILKEMPKEVYTNYLNTTGKELKKYVRHKTNLEKQQQRIEEHQGKLNTGDIPRIFLDPNFNITKQKDFEQVFLVPDVDEVDIFQLERSKNGSIATGTQSNYSLSRRDSGSSIVSEKSCFQYFNKTDLFDGKSFRSYVFLNTKLDYYHDLVGGLLNEQLERKGEAFWKTVKSINSVHSELAEGKQKVEMVRKNLALIDEKVYQRTQKIVNLQQVKINKQRLLKKLHNIACLKDAQMTVQMLLNQNDYANALDCIEMAQDVLATDLKGVTCFRHLGSQLNELEKAIANVLQDEFVYLIEKEFGQPLKKDCDTSYQEGQLNPVIVGLLRVRYYKFVQLLKDQIQEAIKNIIRATVKNHVVMYGKNLDEFDPSTTYNLTQQMKKMDFIQWFNTLEDLFSLLILFCKKIQSIQEMVIENVERIKLMKLKDKEPYDHTSSHHTVSLINGRESNSTFEAVSSQMSIPCNNLEEFYSTSKLFVEYCSLCCQERIVKLLDGKAKNSFIEECTAVQFDMLKRLIMQFGEDSVNVISGDDDEVRKIHKEKLSSWSLTQCLQLQTSRFITFFHEQRRNKLDNLMMSEKWVPIKVPYSYQVFIDSSFKNNRLRLSEEMLTCEDKENSFLYIEGEKYAVNGAVLGLLTMMAEYCTTLEMFPDTAKEMAMNVVEILKNFNSKTCQLLLGAGALTVAGLKTISVKNLALAIRCLQLIIKIIPLIEREFEENLSDVNKNQLRHFSQTTKDLDDHVNMIVSKITQVVEFNMLTSFQNWKLRPKLPSQEIQDVSRQLNKLHNAVTEIMPNEMVEVIFKHVHESFINSFKQMLLKQEVSSEDPLNFGLAEQEFEFYMLSIKAFPYSNEIPSMTISTLLNDVGIM